MPLLAKHPLPSVRAPAAFRHTANALVHRLSFLARRPVLVVDEQEQIVASSQAIFRGQPLSQALQNGQAAWLRVPFCVQNAAGAVLFGGASAGSLEPAGVLKALVTQLLQQPAAGTSRHASQPTGERANMRRRPKDHFIFGLLHGRYRNELEALEQAQLWGIDLRRRRSVMLVDASAYVLRCDAHGEAPGIGEQYRRVRSIMKEFEHGFSTSSDPISAYFGEGRVVLLVPEGDDGMRESFDGSGKSGTPSRSGVRVNGRLATVGGVPLYVACGNAYAGVVGLSRSYQEALQVLTGAQPPGKRARQQVGLGSLAQVTARKDGGQRPASYEK